MFISRHHRLQDRPPRRVPTQGRALFAAVLWGLIELMALWRARWSRPLRW